MAEATCKQKLHILLSINKARYFIKTKINKPFKTDFLEGLILLYSNQISNCLLKKLSFQDSCTPHVKRKKALSIPAFLYMVSLVPSFEICRTNVWYFSYQRWYKVDTRTTSDTKRKSSHFNKAQRTSHIISSQTLFFGRLRSSLL